MIDPEKLIPEVVFTASRSSGAGGQHVNKVNTRVELRFNVSESLVLSASEKEMIKARLGPRITSNGEILVVSDKTRSQFRNRTDCTLRFLDLLQVALTPEKLRIATRPGKIVKEKRLEIKKIQSRKKQNRKKPDL